MYGFRRSYARVPPPSVEYGDRFRVIIPPSASPSAPPVNIATDGGGAQTTPLVEG